MSMTVLITGCSSGFGAAVASRLAADGHRVFATMRDPTGRNAPAASKLRAAAGAPSVLALDVTDQASVDAAFARVESEGGLDAVVHNAGVATIGPLEHQSVELIERLFAVNVLGAVRVQQAALPLLRASRRPRIVVVTSTLARERAPLLGAYTATKHALDALFECWSYELNAEGIRTVLVQPGTVPTTRMLYNLLPSDRVAERADALGARAVSLVDNLRDWGQSSEAPTPQGVVDAVSRALASSCPLHLVVDPSGAVGTARINDVCAEVQDELLDRYGMQDLKEHG